MLCVGACESGERSSCRWCITLFIEYELDKTGPGVGASRRGGGGNVCGGVGDASRVAGGKEAVFVIDSFEGVEAIRGRRPMLTRC